MGPDELCAHTAQRLQRIERGAKRADQARQSIALRDAKTDVLSVELAQARRICFGVKREQLDVQQQPLFEEAARTGIAAREEELAQLKAVPQTAEAITQIPRRQTLPPDKDQALATVGDELRGARVQSSICAPHLRFYLAHGLVFEFLRGD